MHDARHTRAVESHSGVRPSLMLSLAATVSAANVFRDVPRQSSASRGTRERGRSRSLVPGSRCVMA